VVAAVQDIDDCEQVVMSAAISTTAGAKAYADNNRLLRYAALLVTYMQAANVSIPNAALRFIQASLSMTDDEAGWIFTAYLAASAITLPLAQWLAGRFGLKKVYQLSIVTFTAGLLLDTLATTPLEFVGARIVQGAASGILAPLSAAIALETLPAERRAKYGATLGAIVLLGIATGPGIGGWLSDSFGWHAIFYVSLPLSAFIFMVMALFLAEKKAAPGAAFDFFGFGAFTLGMIGLQMLVDRGARMEWFESSEIWVEAIAAGAGLYLFIAHRMTAKALTSPMLDEILGYPPITTGLMTVPRGIGLVGAFVLMNRLSGPYDQRIFVALGVALIIYANWLMLGYSPQMDKQPVIVSGALQGMGLGVLMPSISKVALSTLDPKLRPEASGVFNLLRVYGSALGVAVVQVFFFNNTQAMHLALASHLTPFTAAAYSVTASTPLQALGGLNEMITGQAAFVAVLGQFKILMMAMVAVSPLVFFLRKPASTN
jgi:uncharacterized membrane protein